MSCGTCVHTHTHNINTNKNPCKLFATLKSSSFNTEVLVCRLCLNPFFFFFLYSPEHYLRPGSCLDQDTPWSKLQIIMHVYSSQFPTPRIHYWPSYLLSTLLTLGTALTIPTEGTNKQSHKLCLQLILLESGCFDFRVFYTLAPFSFLLAVYSSHTIMLLPFSTMSLHTTVDYN